MNLAVYTLGCRLNQCESEAIADSFAKAGFTVVGEEGPADLYIVNTCTVTAKAEQKARRMIRLFASRGASVVVTGCYAQMAHKELEALGGKLHIVPLERKAALLSLAGHINAAMLSGMDLDGAIASFTEPTSSVFDYEASSFSYASAWGNPASSISISPVMKCSVRPADENRNEGLSFSRGGLWSGSRAAIRFPSGIMEKAFLYRSMHLLRSIWGSMKAFGHRSAQPSLFPASFESSSLSDG